MPSRCSTCGAGCVLGILCASCGNDPMVGRVVDSKFRVDSRLGSGGMSSVYAGTHLVLGERVAIKFLRVELALDPVLRERFRREAVALARLRHPNIVSLLDFGEDDGELYAVMELVVGWTLDEIVGAGQKLAVLRAGPIFDQILAALQVCHEAEVVHRDLKPGNVMVMPLHGTDYVKLIDFGLARTVDIGIDKLTATGIIQGTLNYMAPEQCRGEVVGPAADIYALGLIMYETLTGAPAYEATNAATFLAQHLFATPAPMREIEPTLSAGLELVVERAIAKDPELRPSAQQMRFELAAALRGTDERSLAEAAAAERRRLGALERNERALTGPQDGRVVGAPVAGNVLAWMPRGPRATALQAALGAAGLPTSTVHHDAVDDVDDRSVIVVSAREDGAARLRQLRAIHRAIAVIVVDVAGVAETSALIREGAADIALAGTADGELAAKVKRVLRRGARTGI